MNYCKNPSCYCHKQNIENGLPVGASISRQMYDSHISNLPEKTKVWDETTIRHYKQMGFRPPEVQLTEGPYRDRAGKEIHIGNIITFMEKQSPTGLTRALKRVEELIMINFTGIGEPKKETPCALYYDDKNISRYVKCSEVKVSSGNCEQAQNVQIHQGKVNYEEKVQSTENEYSKNIKFLELKDGDLKEGDCVRLKCWNRIGKKPVNIPDPNKYAITITNIVKDITDLGLVYSIYKGFAESAEDDAIDVEFQKEDVVEILLRHSQSTESDTKYFSEKLDQVAMANTEDKTTTRFISDLEKVLNNIHQTLVKKNKSYGDSALNPVRIFSKCDSSEGIKVRIDDKLSRLMNGSSFIGDNDVDDLLGYLVLLKISQNKQNETK